MLRFYGELFVGVILDLTEAMLATQFSEDEAVSTERVAKIVDVLDRLKRHCVRAGLELSLDQIERIRTVVSQSQIKGRDVHPALQDLQNRIDDELRRCTLLQISKEKVRFYEKQPFSPAVATHYPSIAKDLDEAGKCFATDRNTACVFHLMRIVEVGLRAVGRSLQLNLSLGSNPTWQKILNDIDTGSKSKSKRWKTRNEEFYAGVVMSITAIKTAVRNPTMHVRGDYEAAEALHIFNVVGGLMRQLAERLDENGKRIAPAASATP